MTRRRRSRDFALYQLAGDLLIDGGNDGDPWRNTPGQRERMTVLLLDALSEPDRWSGRMIREAVSRAKLT